MKGEIRGQAEGEGLPETSASPGCAPLPSHCVSLLLQDYLDALTGICYDGIEGLLFLGLFSLLAALAFSTMTCAGLRAWKHFTTRWAAWRGLPWGAGRRLRSA